jgi:hypothetical protein
MKMPLNNIASARPAAAGVDVRSFTWSRLLVVLLFALWIPVTLYLLLFAPLPMVHDAVHPVRHAFSMIMCH